MLQSSPSPPSKSLPSVCSGRFRQAQERRRTAHAGHLYLAAWMTRMARRQQVEEAWTDSEPPRHEQRERLARPCSVAQLQLVPRESPHDSPISSRQNQRPGSGCCPAFSTTARMACQALPSDRGENYLGLRSVVAPVVGTVHHTPCSVSHRPGPGIDLLSDRSAVVRSMVRVNARGWARGRIGRPRVHFRTRHLQRPFHTPRGDGFEDLHSSGLRDVPQLEIGQTAGFLDSLRRARRRRYESKRRPGCFALHARRLVR
jgi:hypothetical protein